MLNRLLTAYGTFANAFATPALAFANLHEWQKWALLALQASGAAALYLAKPRSKETTT